MLNNKELTPLKIPCPTKPVSLTLRTFKRVVVSILFVNTLDFRALLRVIIFPLKVGSTVFKRNLVRIDSQKNKEQFSLLESNFSRE